MFMPTVVPAPVSMEVLDAEPFRWTGDTVIVGDADAVAVLAELVERRTGIRSGAGQGNAVVSLSIERGAGAPESYLLTVGVDRISVVGADDAGLFYGIQTLVQLLVRGREAAGTGVGGVSAVDAAGRPTSGSSEGAEGTPAGGSLSGIEGRDEDPDQEPRDGLPDAWVVPAARIEDAPRFAHRGVMLDVARHFQGVDVVKAYIDRATSLKFNVLHLHLTDDQGWRIEIKSRPELTAKASGTSVGGDPGGFYTQDDFHEIVAYAAARHMTVVPETDLPGHTHAISLAYPELVEEPVVSDLVMETIDGTDGDVPVNGRPYEGIAVGFSSLKIRDEVTYDFLDDVLRELADLTPGLYLHIGGDEAHGTDPDDFAHIMARASRMVADLGKIPVAWHEAGAASELVPGTVGQYWGFVTPTDGMDAKAQAFVDRGGRLVMSPADAIYLDMKFDADSPLGLTWANGVTSARRAYEWEPTAVVDGLEDDDLLGVEACLWTETVRDLADIDALAFPRIAAAAEAAWSRPLGASELRTWESFRERVGGLGPLWASLGIGFTRLPEFDWDVD